MMKFPPFPPFHMVVYRREKEIKMKKYDKINVKRDQIDKKWQIIINVKNNPKMVEKGEIMTCTYKTIGEISPFSTILH